ncbi:DNA-binding transcriptional LysR family regulator [Bradyrhizobium sp. USDA 4369]
MDRIDAMATLVAAVDAGSLSAASRRLGMPLATVSRKISDLEAHLRTRLLNRTSRRLTLTDAGRAYVAASRRILEEIAEAERSASGEYATPRGSLTVTAPIVFGRLHVLPVISDFLQAYPEIDIRLAMSDRIVNVHEEQVDVALRIGELPDSSLLATRVGTIRRVVCGSPAYFAARGAPLQPSDLATHDCITFDGLAASDAWAFGARHGPLSVRIRSRLVVNTAEAAIDAALSGLGVTRVLSYQVAGAVHAGRLQLALESFEPPPAPVSLVHAGQGLLPLKLRAFLAFAAPRLKARLAEAGLSRGDAG